MKWYEYPVSCIVQNALCKIGIAVHNPFRDECTPDFGCCCKVGKYWLRLGQDWWKFGSKRGNSAANNK